MTTMVTFELPPVQLNAALHALRAMREVRFRTVEMSSDDVLELREITSLVDELADLVAYDAIVQLSATVARLGALRHAVEEFVRGEHVEREGDTQHLSGAYALADRLVDLHAEAVRTALDSHTTV